MQEVKGAPLSLAQGGVFDTKILGWIQQGDPFLEALLYLCHCLHRLILSQHHTWIGELVTCHRQSTCDSLQVTAALDTA